MSVQAAEAYGPSALGGETRRFVELTLTMARTEFKLRYYGSVLGYVWSLMRPLLFFGVLYLFFVKIAQIAKGPYYGAYLLTGIVLFSYSGKLCWGLNADWDLLPDLHGFVTAIESAFAELQEAAEKAEMADAARSPETMRSAPRAVKIATV